MIALLAPAADAAAAHRVHGTGTHAAAVTDPAHAAVADTTAAPADTADATVADDGPTPPR